MVVFSARLARFALTGEELWKGRLPEAGIATPMTYRLAATGRQYVVIAAGGHWGLPAADGAYLVAFCVTTRVEFIRPYKSGHKGPGLLPLREILEGRLELRHLCHRRDEQEHVLRPPLVVILALMVHAFEGVLPQIE